MIRIQCDFQSKTLGMATSFTALIPRDSGAKRRPTHPVLYLLHGLSDDETIWQRRTSIERYAETYPFAIIMPFGARSFYSDSAVGGRYWTFLSEELPGLTAGLLPVSRARGDTYAAGLSMGGYGAFKLGLRCPERFAAVASLSGALDIVRFMQTRPADGRAEFRALLGSPRHVAGSANDLFHLARKLASRHGRRPRFYQCCGTEDSLYDDNRKFLKMGRARGLDITYDEEPGAHDWSFWDRNIQKVLAWMAAMRKARA